MSEVIESMEIDLNSCTSEQLDAIVKAANEAKEQAMIRDTENVKKMADDVQFLAESIGFDLRDYLFPKKVIEVTHRHPENPEWVYKGRGPLPKWMKEAISGLPDDDAKLKLDSFKV